MAEHAHMCCSFPMTPSRYKLLTPRLFLASQLYYLTNARKSVMEALNTAIATTEQINDLLAPANLGVAITGAPRIKRVRLQGSNACLTYLALLRADSQLCKPTALGE